MRYLLIFMLMAGCASKPQGALDSAYEALVGARSYKARECATATYQRAESLYNEAQQLIEEGRYEEAETKLLAARRLAGQAQDEARRQGPDCDKPSVEPEPLPEPEPPEPPSRRWRRWTCKIFFNPSQRWAS